MGLGLPRSAAERRVCRSQRERSAKFKGRMQWPGNEGWGRGRRGTVSAARGRRAGCFGVGAVHLLEMEVGKVAKRREMVPPGVSWLIQPARCGL